MVYFDKDNIIYHPNVEQNSGEIFLEAIKEDWSPYLTLSSVIELIDNAMLEPDLAIVANKDIALEYKAKIESYELNVEKRMRAIRK